MIDLQPIQNLCLAGAALFATNILIATAETLWALWPRAIHRYSGLFGLKMRVPIVVPLPLLSAMGLRPLAAPRREAFFSRDLPE